MKKGNNFLPSSPEHLWQDIRVEAETILKSEPHLENFLNTNILSQQSLASCLANICAIKLASQYLPFSDLYKIASFAYKDYEQLTDSGYADIVATFERDPACSRFINPILYFKGFQALQCHRVANYYLKAGQLDLAYYIQMMISDKFSVDIHPAAEIGKGILIDHAHGIVIGETAVVGNNVSLLHAVTLGGTGKVEGDRHPKIGNGVLIGAGAKVLGNIKIGECSKIASGSVVLSDVPNRKTVAGVPAKIVGEVLSEIDPSRLMDHKFESSN